MSAGISLFKRMGGALRTNGGRVNGAGHSPTLLLEPHNLEPRNGVITPQRSNGSSLLPWVRMREKRELADERYQQVIDIMSAMCAHFERQDKHATEMAAALTSVGRTLERLADTEKQQSDQVAAIASRMSDAARHTEGLMTLLSEMPASMQSQADAVRTVAEKMEASRAADAELGGSLRQFSEAADALRGAGTAQAEALNRLHTDEQRRAERVEHALARQNRLMLTITVVVCILGIGVIGGLAVAARMIFIA